MIMSYKISHPKGRKRANSSEYSQKKNCETKMQNVTGIWKNLHIEVLS